MVPIEQKDGTGEDRGIKPGQNRPLDSTKRPNSLIADEIGRAAKLSGVKAVACR
jgi:hypothetical protein